MSLQTNPLSTVLTQITDAELTLLKGPLLDFSKALQAPNANVLSLENELANIALQLPQLSGPAQTIALNIVGVTLEAWINSLNGIPVVPAPQPAPAPLVSSVDGNSVVA